MKMANEYVDELVDVLTDEPEDIYETGHRLQAIVKAIRQEAVEECVKAISCINVTYQGVWIGYKTAVDAIRKVGEEPYLKKCTEMTEEEWADRNERP